MESQRFDFALGECSIEETGEGYLKLKGIIAKPGIYPYIEGGRVIREFVPPEELFSQETVRSADGVPLTDDHPTQAGIPVMLTSGDAPVHARGAVMSPAIEDGKLSARIAIWDKDCIEATVSGKTRQLSIGRTTRLEETSGHWNGEPYDRIQRNIRINHVAVVDRGRQGPEVKFLIDRGESMLTYRCDKGTDVQIAPEAMDDLNSRNKKITDLEAKIKTDSAELESLKTRLAAVNPSAPDPKGDAEKQKLLTQIEALTASVASFEQKYNSLKESVPGMVDAMVQEKTELTDAAKAVAPDVKVDGLSPREIRLKVIEKKLPYESTIKVDSLSDDLIKSRFDAIMDAERIRANLEKTGGNRGGVTRIDRAEIDRKREALQNFHNPVTESK